MNCRVPTSKPTAKQDKCLSVTVCYNQRINMEYFELNSTDNCENAFKVNSGPVWNVCMISSHFLTILLCLGMSKFAYDKTDIAHPVFAIIFHEMVVLSSLQFALLLLYLVKKSFEDFSPTKEKIDFLIMFIISFAMFYHQISWLCITCLRYQILLLLYARHN